MSEDFEKWKKELVTNLEESLYFFSNKNKFEREKYVARRLLESNEVSFDEGELKEGEEPVDVVYRELNFQVKELMQVDRRRHAELKNSLEKAKNTQCYSDMSELYSPRDMDVSEIVSRVVSRSVELAEKKYGPKELAKLDLLCYCNFTDVCEVKSAFDLPENSPFRSISFVSNRYRMVIYADDSASAILRKSVGILRTKQ